jgi:hypothetical protein
MSYQAIIQDLLVMNRDALAALVQIGGDEPLKFVRNETDRYIVSQMIKQAEVEPRTAAGSLD